MWHYTILPFRHIRSVYGSERIPMFAQFAKFFFAVLEPLDQTFLKEEEISEKRTSYFDHSVTSLNDSYQPTACAFSLGERIG